MRGTPYDIDPRGKILLLEDLDELLYHMDRMMMNLQLAGWFKDLAGLVVGGMSRHARTRTRATPSVRARNRSSLRATAGTRLSGLLRIPFGHIADNRALVLGQKAKLSVTENGATLSFEGGRIVERL